MGRPPLTGFPRVPACWPKPMAPEPGYEPDNWARRANSRSISRRWCRPGKAWRSTVTGAYVSSQPAPSTQSCRAALSGKDPRAQPNGGLHSTNVFVGNPHTARASGNFRFPKSVFIHVAEKTSAPAGPGAGRNFLSNGVQGGPGAGRKFLKRGTECEQINVPLDKSKIESLS